MSWLIERWLARHALLRAVLVAIGAGCSEPSAGGPQSMEAGAKPDPRVEGIAASDVPAILQCANAVGIHEIERVVGHDSGSCSVFAQPRALDKLATSQRILRVWRADGSGPSEADTISVDGWSTSRHLAVTQVTAHLPVGGQTLDVRLLGEDPVSSAEALRIVSAIEAGAVRLRDEAPLPGSERVVGIRRPVKVAIEVLALQPPHEQLDASDVEVAFSVSFSEGIIQVLHVGPSDVSCVGGVSVFASPGNPWW